MKLFQLYPKALAHFACKSPSGKGGPSAGDGPRASEGGAAGGEGGDLGLELGLGM